MPDNLSQMYLAECADGFRALKKLADGAIAQATESDLTRTPDDESNSIAVLMRHIAGNARSRFTDFLHSDGEKPTRDRDGEFGAPPEPTRAALLQEWEAGWRTVFEAVSSLSGADLTRTVTIGGESHTVLRALERMTRHYAQHVGQIVYLAKHWRGSEWRTLSIPRNRDHGRTTQTR